MNDQAPHPASSPTAKRRRMKLSTLNWPRPRCPQCNGALLRKYRSIANQGDGTALSWVICANQACNHRFRILLE